MEPPFIQALKRHPRKHAAVVIELSDGTVFEANDEAVYRLALRKGMPFVETLRVGLTEDALRLRAKNTAIAFIKRRLRSAKEVRQKLKEKEVPPAVIDNVVESLQTIGLIDDTAFAKAYVRDRLRFRPRSFALMAKELARHGVSDAVIRSTLASMKDESDDRSVALDLARAYIARPSALRKKKLADALARFLAGKGFSYSVIVSVTEELRKQGALKQATDEEWE